MARGPDLETYADELSEQDGLSRAELAFSGGLEKIIDRAMDTHRPGQPFVYGIHQALSPRMIEAMLRRYRGAGWRGGSLREGETGAFILVLRE